MLKALYFNRIRATLFLITVAAFLLGCAGRKPEQEGHIKGETRMTSEGIFPPSATPTPTPQIHPTRTFDIYRPDTVRVTFAAQGTQNVGPAPSTPWPSPTPTLSPRELCQPFPDEIQ